MREVSFEKALKYANKDIVMVSPRLKECMKNVKNNGSKSFRLVNSIAEEMPAPMQKINEAIIEVFDHAGYIDIMSNSKFYVIEY